MPHLDLGQILGIIVLVSSALAAVIFLAKTIGRAARRGSSFLDEVMGTPAEFGRDARPGLIEKVDHIATTQGEMRDTQDEHTAQLQKILHELWPNGGGSMRDAVDRLERQVSVQVTVNPAAEQQQQTTV